MARAPSTVSPVSFHPRSGNSALAARLRREIEGEVLFDPASRGRYSTDASIYQIDPVGVVVPKTEQDAKIALQIAVEEGVPVLPRGAGSRRNRGALAEGAAARAGLQPGFRETSRRMELRAAPGRLRRHARVFQADPSEALAAAPVQDPGRVPFPVLPPIDGSAATHS